MKSDYLKFWRVVRYYIKAKHGLTESDLDILLFLYSEGYFDKDKFSEFDNLISWNKNRFEDLRQAGWIEVFRKRDVSKKKKAIYQLSFKGNNVVKEIYNKLNGEEIPTSLAHNPMYDRNASFNDKVYRHFIKLMNLSLQKTRRGSVEDI
jgi:hypothetical protein